MSNDSRDGSGSLGIRLLSHMLERTGGLYLPIASGATVAFARAAKFLAKDFELVKPTVIISVPRVFEAIYAKVQQQIAKESSLKRALFSTAINTGWQQFIRAVAISL